MSTLTKAALFSVTDKTGIVSLAKAIRASGRVILSTGGTADTIRQGGTEVVDVEQVTGFPSIMDGRLKTLHPKIFGGILHDRKKPEHLEEARRLIGLEYDIDIVVVNLYDFATKPSIERIDIGGPSQQRAGGKNNEAVAVLSNPNQYPAFIEELQAGEISQLTRLKLTAALFRGTSTYNAAIADWFDGLVKEAEKLANQAVRV